MIRPFAQNIWDLRPPVSVEFRRGQHEKAWAPPNTLGRILARVLHAETARRRAAHPRARRRRKEKPSSPNGAAGFDFNQCHHAVLSVSFVAPIFTDN